MLLALNKPYDVLCQFTAEPGSDSLANYVDVKGVYPAGRLDKDSEGLVLLTDDGRLQARIAEPVYKLPKTYWVQVEGVPDETSLTQLRTGVTLKDGVTAPATVSATKEPEIWPRVPPIRIRAAIPTSWLTITITEGRNRQIRRMTAAVGYPTLRLIRYAIGPWTLDGLLPGQWRRLRQEWQTLKQYYDSHDIQTPPDRRRRDRAAGKVSHGRGKGRRPTRA